VPRAKTHLTYGETGTFKTSQVGIFARYIWRKYRKRTRLISADPGGWAPIEPEIQAGIVDPYLVVGLKEPLPTLRKFSLGFWPKKSDDMTKAVMEETKTWDDIGAYAIEGLTSISDLYMSNLRTKKTGGEDTTVDLTIEGEKFAGNNRSHYNFVQNEVLDLSKRFGALPVHNILWTAHEGKGEDEGTREPIRGPQLAGKAATAKVPSWFGDCIHFESYPEEVEVESTDPSGKKFKSKQLRSLVRAYFTRHPDPKFPNISYPAKPRVPPSQALEMFKKYPGGYFVLQPSSGIDEYLEFEDELEARALSAVSSLMAEAETR
jgi:hypothetical protein